MKRSRFWEQQIIGILKEQEAGVSVADLCRNDAMLDNTALKELLGEDGDARHIMFVAIGHLWC